MATNLQLEILQNQIKARDQVIAANNHSIEQLKKKLALATTLIDKAEAILTRASEKEIQVNHLLIALLHSVGPKLSLRIENFQEFFADREIKLEMQLTEEDLFTATVTLVDPDEVDVASM